MMINSSDKVSLLFKGIEPISEYVKSREVARCSHMVNLKIWKLLPLLKAITKHDLWSQ